MSQINLNLSKQNLFSSTHENPLKILIVGNFSGGSHIPQTAREKLRVHQSNFSEIFSLLDVEFKILGGETIKLKSPLHFQEEHIGEQYSKIKELEALSEKIIPMTEFDELSLEIFDETDSNLVRDLLGDIKALEHSNFDILLSEIENKKKLLLENVFESPDFIELYNRWNALRFLLSQTKYNESCVIEILDLSKEDIIEDLDENRDLSHSNLFEKIYYEELGVHGGVPFNLVILDHSFKSSNKEIQVLESLCTIFSWSFTPVFTAVDSNFFDLNSWKDIPSIENFQEHLEISHKLASWRNFSRKSHSSMLNFVFPELKYPNLLKNEQISPSATAIYCLLCIISGSYVLSNWANLSLGPDSAKILDTIKPNYLFTEEQSKILIQYGFNPVLFHQEEDYCYFENLVNAHQTSFSGVFILSKIAQKLKILQRENIGSSDSENELVTSMNRWLMELVSDMDAPSPKIKAKRPLRSAKIALEKLQKEGWYKMKLEIETHQHISMIESELSLDGVLVA